MCWNTMNWRSDMSVFYVNAEKHRSDSGPLSPCRSRRDDDCRLYPGNRGKACCRFRCITSGVDRAVLIVGYPKWRREVGTTVPSSVPKCEGNDLVSCLKPSCVMCLKSEGRSASNHVLRVTRATKLLSSRPRCCGSMVNETERMLDT